MPFLAPVVGFLGTWGGQLLLSVAVSVGTSLLKQLFAPKRETKKPGINVSVNVGDDNPLFMMVGHSATGGIRRYINSYGEVNGVPNAYLVEVIQLDCFPDVGLDLNNIWLNKEKITVLTGEPHPDRGWPIAEYRIGSRDHAWIKFRDGTDIAADPYLISEFGSDPNYPWQSDMIGRGAPHVILTALLDKDRELWKTQPTWLFEITPRKFYDWRKDSTNGGSGLHRWGDPSTYEPTKNPIVIAYNIIRGIYYNGVWMYGGRNLPAFRLPVASWTAAANECDLPVTVLGGGTRPQFECGMKLDFDVEPLTAIEELMRACLGRLSETGGIFEVIAGAPAAPVFHFTDDDIIVTRSQGYRSFPSLNDSQNAIEATYLEPAEMWAVKDAPARYNPTWEAEDGGRRLATGLHFGAVPNGHQVQQLMESFIRENRNWRIHVIALPPTAWVLTGTSTVSWTSERNGYVNKQFIVQKISGETSKIQLAVIIETDSSDYSWNGSMELPNPIGNLVVVRPAPQPIVGATVAPAILNDSQGRPRRPAILVTVPGNMPDIRAVHVLVQISDTGDFVWQGEIPYEAPYANLITGEWCLPNEKFDVTLQYMPYSGRSTVPTMPFTVTMFDIKLTELDVVYEDIDLPALGDDIREMFEWISSGLRETIRQSEELATNAAGEILQNFSQHQQIRREMSLGFRNVTADYMEAITAAVGPDSAIVSRIETLEVTIGDDFAQIIDLIETQIGPEGALARAITSLSAGSVDGDVATANLQMVAQAGPGGVSSRIGFEARADGVGSYRGAALFLDVPVDPNEPTQVVIDAQRFVLTDSSQTEQFHPFIFEDGIMRVNGAYIRELTALNIQNNSLDSTVVNVENLLAQDAHITGLLRVGPGSGSAGVFIDGNLGRILIVDNT